MHEVHVADRRAGLSGVKCRHGQCTDLEQFFTRLQFSSPRIVAEAILATPASTCDWLGKSRWLQFFPRYPILGSAFRGFKLGG